MIGILAIYLCFTINVICGIRKINTTPKNSETLKAKTGRKDNK